MAQHDLTVDRRVLLKSGGGLLFTIGSAGLVAGCEGEQAIEAPGNVSAQSPISPNIWVTLYPDDRIKIMFAATEMGQGAMTHVPLILAEEMDAAWDKVEVETVAVHDQAYGNPIFGNFLYTAGSTAVEGYFDPLRIAGAQARLILLNAAARQWDLPVSELETEPSFVIHRGSGRRLSYGEIATFAQMPQTLPSVDNSMLKPIGDYRYIGKSVPRTDVPSKVKGAAEYGIDVRVPGMLYASVLRSPSEGQTPLSVNADKARKASGFVDVVELPNAVAIVGETYWSAVEARRALEVTWSDAPSEAFDSERDLEEYAEAAADLTKKGTVWRDAGDIDTAFETAAASLQAEYRSDYAYHGAMEPAASVAHVKDTGEAELWVGTQTQSMTILGVAALLDIAPEKVTLHPMLMGGSFGFRVPLTEQKWAEDALLISKAIGKPIKVVWSREDDLKTGLYRPVAAQFMRAALSESGSLVGWNQRVASASPLSFMNPIRWKGAEGKDIIAMNGSESPHYAIPNKRAEHLIMDRRARLCALRGVSASYTAFAAESFVDEVAHHTGQDPLDLRLALCADAPRVRAVLEKLGEVCNWRRDRGERGIGLALAGYKKSIAAGAVELSVDRQTGEIDLHKVWIVGDIGLVVSPRNAEAQMRGGVVYALSLALKEQITIVNGQTQQNNFYDYPVLRMNEVPDIDVHILPTDNPPTGVGELGVPMTAPAISNAVYAATGARLRHVPFLPARVRAALNA